MGRPKGTPNFERAPQRKGLEYTERQLGILSDDIPLSLVSLNELTNIMIRANERGDSYHYQIAQLMYEAKMNSKSYRPKMTVSEAKIILQALTPWKIIWV